MSDDRSEDRSDRSQRNPRTVQMTTAVDPSLRTDYRLLGLFIALVLLFVAASVHSSDEYTHVATMIALALALLVALVSVPFTAFRETR